MPARERFGVNKCWTREGNIYVIGLGGKWHWVPSMMELGVIYEDALKPVAVSEAKSSVDFFLSLYNILYFTGVQ